jgi:hypothetical protein
MVFSALVMAQAGTPCPPCPPCPPVEVEIAQATQAWWEILLSYLVEIVASLMLVVIPVLVRAALAKWGEKLSVDKQVAVQRLVDGVLGSAVAFAEEQAKKALHDGGERTPGAQKMDQALAYAKRQLESSGVGVIAEEDLVAWMEARLHLQRAAMADAARAEQKRLELSDEA